MSNEAKRELCILIDRLATRQGETQYYEGEKHIDKQGIEILKQFIKGYESK